MAVGVGWGHLVYSPGGVLSSMGPRKIPFDHLFGNVWTIVSGWRSFSYQLGASDRAANPIGNNLATINIYRGCEICLLAGFLWACRGIKDAPAREGLRGL